MTNPTYFQVFDLPRRLALDVPALEQKFYALSRRLHPDRFASKSVAEQEDALAESSRLNDAYRTLTGGEKKQVVPPELLEEVFELNMQLQEMRMAREMGEDEPELRRDLMTAKDAFDAKMVETQAELEGLWAGWDLGVDVGDEAAKTRAKEAMVALLNKRSYLRNLVRDVNEALGF